jgi:hypothetical protein
MAELDEKTKNEPESPVEEKTIDKAMKPVNKSLINLDKAIEPDSETSSLAPDDDETLANSTAELKVKVPRKLMEDERRATGRISTAVWMTYFRVSSAEIYEIKLMVGLGWEILVFVVLALIYQVWLISRVSFLIWSPDQHGCIADSERLAKVSRLSMSSDMTTDFQVLDKCRS